MKNFLFFTTSILFFGHFAIAQVTQINSNNSLQFEYPLSNTKAVYSSTTDETPWVTDGTLAGTIQLASDISFVNALGSTAFLNGKLIFSGSTAATGTELFITDGTPAGTTLLKDIYAGPTGSDPDFDAVVLNGFLYFIAATAAEGRELWRTDGTPGGTTIVKDIVPGPTGSNTPGNYHLFSSGSYLLFAANNASSGVELWKSDGSNAGTSLLLDINNGHAGADSSNPRDFYLINNIVLFAATDATHGDEIWRTDGTVAGTTILKDINTGTTSSTKVTIDFGFGITYDLPIFSFFHTFNNRAYFNATDGASIGEVWSTDGTSANTALLKDIVPGNLAPGSFKTPMFLLIDAVNLPGKFIFPVADTLGNNQLWESDGTAANTKVFKSFDGGELPILFPGYNYKSLSQNQSQVLFQGNKFFFMAKTAAEGRELWVSDGTIGNTHLVKDINPGAADGLVTSNVSYTYTTNELFFPATNVTNGIELWKSDGTSGGTTMVADIVTGASGSNTNLDYFIINGKVVFGADNADNPTETDLYAVDGTFTPLPVKLLDFTVTPKSADAVLNWQTSQEVNSKSYTVQRSFDGVNFENIGVVSASGNSTSNRAYSYIDIGIINSGKSVVYYRLMSLDLDGKGTASAIITLKIKGTDQWNVKLLSNPVTENIKLLLSGFTANIQLSVVDIHGKKLYSIVKPAINGQISLPASSLPKGIYMLVTETVNERKTIQFVK